MDVFQREIEETLPNVAEQMVNDVKEAQATYSLNLLDDSAAKALKEQIIGIASPEHRIKQLICKLKSLVCSPKNAILLKSS